MLLAEALNERREVIKRISETGARWARELTWDEDGDEPDREVATRATEGLDKDLARLEELNIAINGANNRVKLPSGKTIMESIAERDRLNFEHKVLEQTARNLESEITGGARVYERRKKDDVKTRSLVKPRDLTARADAAAARIRRLDLEIQKVNWTTEV